MNEIVVVDTSLGCTTMECCQKKTEVGALDWRYQLLGKVQLLRRVLDSVGEKRTFI